MEKRERMFRGPMDVILFVLMNIIVLGVFLQFLLRYLLQIPFSGADEIVTQSFVFMVFVGAVGALRSGQIINIDILQRVLRTPFKEYLEIGINVITWFFFLAIVIYGTKFAFANVDQASFSYRVPKVYYYIVLPICAVFMGVTVTQNIITIIKSLKHRGESGGKA